MTTEATSPETLIWAIGGLCAAITGMALYIARQADQRRKDDRATMERTMIDAKDVRDSMIQVVKDNTSAMSRLTSAVDSMQKTFHLYTRHDR